VARARAVALTGRLMPGGRAGAAGGCQGPGVGPAPGALLSRDRHGSTSHGTTDSEYGDAVTP
jgi:hypothetical protein